MGRAAVNEGEAPAAGRARPFAVERASHPGYERDLRTRAVGVGPVAIGGPEPVIIAGPCAVESREQTLRVARAVAAAGARMLRGGAFKPRTSPYSFQGLGEEGLEILAEARAETGLPVVTEVLDPRQVELVASYADMLQIGSRSMHNVPLLVEVGRARKPVLLKRGYSATVEEWICSAEYIALEGNLEIVFCERGIRTFANGAYDRSTLDLGAVHALRLRTPLPVIVDPSHAAGAADLVAGLAAAGLLVGAHGLLIEVIASDAERGAALCDGEQAITPEVLRRIVAQARA